MTALCSNTNPQDFDPFAFDYDVTHPGFQAKERLLKNFGPGHFLPLIALLALSHSG